MRWTPKNCTFKWMYVGIKFSWQFLSLSVHKRRQTEIRVEVVILKNSRLSICSRLLFQFFVLLLLSIQLGFVEKKLRTRCSIQFSFNGQRFTSDIWFSSCLSYCFSIKLQWFAFDWICFILIYFPSAQRYCTIYVRLFFKRYVAEEINWNWLSKIAKKIFSEN